MISQAKQEELKCRNTEIAQLRATGKTFSEISKQFNISIPRAHQILSNPEIKEIHDTSLNILASYTPVSLSAFIDILQDNKASDHYRAVTDHLRAMGILESRTGGNTYIQNVFNPATTATVTESTRFTELLELRRDTDVQDAEYTEEMDSLREDS